MQERRWGKLIEPPINFFQTCLSNGTETETFEDKNALFLRHTGLEKPRHYRWVPDHAKKKVNTMELLFRDSQTFFSWNTLHVLWWVVKFERCLLKKSWGAKWRSKLRESLASMSYFLQCFNALLKLCFAPVRKRGLSHEPFYVKKSAFSDVKMTE